MRVALIVDLNENRGSGYFKSLAREFVNSNTLIIDKAEIREIADQGDLARGDRTVMLRFSSKATQIL
ncbi:hypothetical protein H0W91_02055 [Patescibacteria group bacterium]|nr:hypothetical protein [Patescibacteria group bacterium]